MNQNSLKWILAVVTLASIAAPASAQVRRGGLATANKVSLAVALGYGFTVTDEGDLDGDPNPYALGFGLRAGYTLDAGVYLGLLSQIYGGEKVGNDTVNGRIYQTNFAAEIGYDLALGDTLALRPSVAIGSTVSMGEVCVLDRCSSDHTDPYLLVAPAVTLVIALGKLYVGGEVRYFFLPDNDIPDGLLLGAQIGVLL
jgi:hypothetical protein